MRQMLKKNLSSAWFLNAKTEKEKEEVKNLVLNSSRILELISNVLNRELKELDTPSKKDYDKPSWAYYAADNNGYKRAIKKLKDIIEIEEKND